MKLIAAWALLLLAFASVVAGVAFIYWPAGLIVGGVLAAAVAALVLDVGEPPPPPDDTR